MPTWGDLTRFKRFPFRDKPCESGVLQLNSNFERSKRVILFVWFSILYPDSIQQSPCLFRPRTRAGSPFLTNIYRPQPPPTQNFSPGFHLPTPQIPFSSLEFPVFRSPHAINLIMWSYQTILWSASSSGPVPKWAAFSGKCLKFWNWVQSAL